MKAENVREWDPASGRVTGAQRAGEQKQDDLERERVELGIANKILEEYPSKAAKWKQCDEPSLWRRLRASRADLLAHCARGEHWMTPWIWSRLTTSAAEMRGLDVMCWRSWCRVCHAQNEAHGSEPKPKHWWQRIVSRKEMLRRSEKRAAVQDS